MAAKKNKEQEKARKVFLKFTKTVSALHPKLEETPADSKKFLPLLNKFKVAADAAKEALEILSQAPEEPVEE